MANKRRTLVLRPVYNSCVRVQTEADKQMETLPPNRFEGSPGFWVLIATVVLLNVWYDYYHPLGIIFDVVFGVGVLVTYLNKSR
jgi:hypothetical protein